MFLCVTKHQKGRLDLLLFRLCLALLEDLVWVLDFGEDCREEKRRFSCLNANIIDSLLSILIVILQIFSTEMGKANVSNPASETHRSNRNLVSSMFDPAISRFLGHSQKLQNQLKSQLKNLRADKDRIGSSWRKDKESSVTSMKIDLEKQLDNWRENTSWTDQNPIIKVSIPKGSLCNLKAEVNVGLPPDAVYNIVIDPDYRKVFKNIKEVLSQKVLVDEGLRQVVEVELAALWRFLWFSGTVSVHALVEQNRADHSMKFKQVKSEFMKRFEGNWQVKPLFVDEHMCDRMKPKTLEEYNQCSGGKGRIGSKVTLDQLIEPAIVPPPPISWYIRGITAKTTEMLVHDLLDETARIRNGFSIGEDSHLPDEHRIETSIDIKKRWAAHRRTSRRRRNVKQESNTLQ